MQEPHKKGLANHLDPESCAGDREAAGEAFDRGTSRPAIELRNHHSGVPTLCYEGEGNMKDDVKREPSCNAAESETLSMRGNSMRENRETPVTPLPLAARDGRRRPQATRPACTSLGSRTIS